ncbi:hypothetical protein MUA95_09715 [Staphylococcus agnetis]|uniref:Phage protein n=1 Tax=Staphylococcus agnetis TaxID=985762 RepID=A0ABD7TSX4_9STAP|nr:hypothetical protein [Staphylococcus agnetis]UXU56829.1 hypothetical protein MUA95_09715 [Staphylococcus agnetis]
MKPKFRVWDKKQEKMESDYTTFFLDSDGKLWEEYDDSLKRYDTPNTEIEIVNDERYDVVIEDYKSERDTLIADITRLRAERDEYKRKLDDVVELFTRHINYKLSVSHNTWYINLRHKLDEVLKDENQS